MSKIVDEKCLPLVVHTHTHTQFKIKKQTIKSQVTEPEQSIILPFRTQHGCFSFAQVYKFVIDRKNRKRFPNDDICSLPRLMT
jgi:hypothetical protein